MILSDVQLLKMLPELLSPAAPEHVNPASIDICIGPIALRQHHLFPDDWVECDLIAEPLKVLPGELVLVQTYEKITVPNGYAIDLRLKSSRAREGWNHSLAFWFDPGWSGKGTMEIINQRKVPMLLIYQQPFAQIIVHQLSSKATNPYKGRYQGAETVEGAKRE